MNSAEKQLRYLDVFGAFRIPKNYWYYLGSMTLTVLLLLTLFRVIFVNFADKHELAYKFDRRSGELEVYNRTGYFVTWPFIVNVHTIDMRPGQVCISKNKRVLNCKLVKFNRNGLDEFVSWHGRRDYEWRKVSSTGQTGEDGDNTLTDILAVYAYDGQNREYSFMTVVEELVPGKSMAPPGN